MRTMTSNFGMNHADRENIRTQQEQRMKRMVSYQKNMERFLNRKKANHHMIRKG